jgi:cytochrome b subunit of formate dehydrogenase
MNKMKLLRILNLILFIVFVVQVLTGLAMFFQLKFLNVGQVSEIHAYNGLLLVVLWLGHIILNWAWIKSTYFKRAQINRAFAKKE